MKFTMKIMTNGICNVVLVNKNKSTALLIPICCKWLNYFADSTFYIYYNDPTSDLFILFRSYFPIKFVIYFIVAT